MPRVKVLHVVESTVGGVREHLRQIFARVDRDRFELSLICSTCRDPSCNTELDGLVADGFTVVRVPMTRSIRPLRDARCYLRIRRHMEVLRFDVVHTHGSKGGFLGRLAASRAGGRRVIHTGHTFPFQWARGARGALFASLERRAAAWSDVIVALTQAQRRQLIDRRICPESKIAILPNGVEIPPPITTEARARAREQLGLPHDGIVVGMVGRIVEQKDPLLFVRTAHAVVPHAPNASFVWIGDGELRREMERALPGPAQRSLLLAGHRDDARRLLAALDVFLLTTRWEGMPYSLLEAMAAGLPAVAANVPGIDEVVDEGKTGYVVEPAPEAAARAVLRLAGDAALRRDLGTAGRERVERLFTVDRFIEGLQRLYQPEEHHGREDH